MSRLALASTATAALAVFLAVTGCGGGDDGCRWHYPQYRYLTLYLRVEKPNGDPLPGATVTIEGKEVNGLTAGRWYAIGRDGPAEWRGWLHNWAVEDYRVRINRKGQVRTLTVHVFRDGWGWDAAEVEIADADPVYVYVRIIFVLGVTGSQGPQGPKIEYFKSPVSLVTN